MSVQPAYWHPANRVVTDASGHVIVAGAESLEHARQALELNPATIGRYRVSPAFEPAPAPVVTPRVSREVRARAIATVAAELQAAAAGLERAVAARERIIDRLVQSRLATDPAYLRAENADQAAEREQEIEEEELARYNANTASALRRRAEAGS